MPYEEVLGWFEFFDRFPPEWRADRRAAIISMSMAGDKVKPEDLFDSLRVIKDQMNKVNSETASVSSRFVDRFKHLFTEKVDFIND